jgi:hypothetical protein
MGCHKVIGRNLRRGKGKDWIFNFFPFPKGLFLSMGVLSV